MRNLFGSDEANEEAIDLVENAPNYDDEDGRDPAGGDDPEPEPEDE